MSPEQHIKQYYKDILGREADSGGLTYWLSEFQSGRMSLSSIQGHIANSDEKLCQSQNRWGKGSNNLVNNQACYRESEIRIIYKNVLLRDPDSPGLQWWHGQNLSVAAIYAAIYSSGEAKCTRKEIPIPKGYPSCYAAALDGVW